MADQHDPNGAYSEVFEEGMDIKQAQTVHRIRANSSIMQLKKILGKLFLADWATTNAEPPTNLRFYHSTVANRGEIRKYYHSAYLLSRVIDFL